MFLSNYVKKNWGLYCTTCVQLDQNENIQHIKLKVNQFCIRYSSQFDLNAFCFLQSSHLNTKNIKTEKSKKLISNTMFNTRK